jgi:hypothetical protein
MSGGTAGAKAWSRNWLVWFQQLCVSMAHTEMLRKENNSRAGTAGP